MPPAVVACPLRAESGQARIISASPLCAISRLMHRNKKHLFDQLAISAEQLSFSDWKLRITSFGLST
jgi:hypothetical protein